MRGGDNMNHILVDYRINEIEKNNLLKLNLEIIVCPPCKDLYKAVCGHPDMLVHFIGRKQLILHNNMEKDFISSLKNYGMNVILSEKKLETNYPKDIILNAINIKNFFIHTLAFTDINLLDSILFKKLININQGYSKCSAAIVSDTALITSDVGIYTALSREGLDILLLPPGDILLPGLNYGFIGGCCGLINESQLAFYGDLDYYLYGNEVKNFLKKHGVEPIYLRKGKLIDRGSMFVF